MGVLLTLGVPSFGVWICLCAAYLGYLGWLSASSCKKGSNDNAKMLQSLLPLRPSSSKESITKKSAKKHVRSGLKADSETAKSPPTTCTFPLSRPRAPSHRQHSDESARTWYPSPCPRLSKDVGDSHQPAGVHRRDGRPQITNSTPYDGCNTCIVYTPCPPASVYLPPPRLNDHGRPSMPYV